MPRRLLLLAFPLLVFLVVPAAAQPDDGNEALPSIAEKTDGLEKRGGFFPLYWDARAGTVYLEIPRLGENVLYLASLPTGLGSNPVGLDRGQLGGEQVVRFERAGPKVLVVAPNLKYRATSDNPAERRAVREAFAEGVLYGFEAVAQTDGRVLVDATSFMVRDAYDIAQRLQETGQGTFRLDESRSAPFMERTKAFPDNTELTARLTFTSEDPGRYVRRTAAAPEAVTLRVRQSFVRLPDTSKYEPRRFDPRSGYFYTGYADYAVPIGSGLQQRLIARHRLQKRDPDAAVSRPVEPITYYLDRGTPQPVRSALLEGARWWNDAFRAAGFKDAFRVKLMPEGADPMDVRYNVIQWVHRATRGWSYGASVTDPRTGEIIKGHVTLGSQRVRQDYLLAEGLLAPYTGEHAGGFPPGEDPMLKMALARIRQLAAHEVGHTLGLAHNFAASAEEVGRASVMDYPAPLATVTEGGEDSNEISLENAYDTGVGEWDRLAIRYGYGQPPGAESEDAFRQSILREMQDEGFAYLTDADARPSGAAEPSANLWDNGRDVTEALRREMRVRREALDRFGEAVVREGEPLALMEEALVPLYLRHRYQVQATAKLLGGVRYSYALRTPEVLDRSRSQRGDQHRPPTPVEAGVQHAALDALLRTVTPQALALPEAARRAIPPRPPGYGENRELFDGYTGLTFDPYAPAETAAQMTLSQLLVPARMARLAYQDDFGADRPGLADVLGTVTTQVWKQPPPEGAYEAALARTVQQVWTDALLNAAQEEKLASPVRAQLTAHLSALEDWLAAHPGPGSDAQAHRALARRQIARFLERPYRPDAPTREPLDVPPGSPIGTRGPGH